MRRLQKIAKPFCVTLVIIAMLFSTICVYASGKEETTMSDTADEDIVLPEDGIYISSATAEGSDVEIDGPYIYYPDSGELVKI